MFNDVIVVQSAVSAFNNAALFAPAFFWWAILAVPLMIVVWWCAPTILDKLQWGSNNFMARCGVWLSVFTFLWLVLFGGNYQVLRDGATVLPFMIAVVVFLTSLFVGSHIRDFDAYKPSVYVRVACTTVLIIALGLSDMHAWWGPVLQIGACVAGWCFGRLANGAMRPAAGMVLIMLMVVASMLMQPEFFRFGQLGNLTPIHLLFIMLMAVCGMAVVAINNVKPLARIGNGVYVKLKWLMRVIVLLTMALFLLTESVPLFFGVCVSTLVMFAMSVWHCDRVTGALSDQVLAIMLVLFGAMTCMPVVSAMGVLWWTVLPRQGFWTEIKRLL